MAKTRQISEKLIRAALVRSRQVETHLDAIRDRANDLQDDLHFIKSAVKNPSNIGAVKPTSKFAARKMASVIPENCDQPVLELGPGTGPVTNQILVRGLAPENLVAVEYNEAFYRHLKASYPEINLIQGNAFDLENTLEKSGFGSQCFCATLSVLPLLLFKPEERHRLTKSVLAHMEPGAPFVQLSYGTKPPVAASPEDFTITKLDTILRNVPPARLWIYRQAV